MTPTTTPITENERVAFWHALNAQMHARSIFVPGQRCGEPYDPAGYPCPPYAELFYYGTEIDKLPPNERADLRDFIARNAPTQYQA